MGLFVATLAQVGYLPKNARWWLADLVVEHRRDGEAGNVVHYNLTMIRADSAEEAHAKALKFGHQQDRVSDNADGSYTIVKFRGLRDLLVVYEEPVDGSELVYEEREDLSEEQILASLCPKEQLSVFEPWPPLEEPTARNGESG